MSRIEDWATATQKHEGFYKGSRSYRNNSPGNFRYTKYTASLGANKGKDDKNFIIYNSYEIGFNALKQFLTDACNGELRAYRPDMTLLQFYGVYAPSADGNSPKNYATFIANSLGVPISLQIKYLLDIQDNFLPHTMKVLSQRDPIWAGDYIGKTKVTIGKQGCTITCISMLSDYYNCFHTPAWMADNLRFTADAKLFWQSVSEKLCFDFTWRGYSPDYVKIDAAIKDPETAVILEVENYHWVVALSKVPLTKIYRIADPWTGSKGLSTRYRYISGYATFKTKK